MMPKSERDQSSPKQASRNHLVNIIYCAGTHIHTHTDRIRLKVVSVNQKCHFDHYTKKEMNTAEYVH